MLRQAQLDKSGIINFKEHLYLQNQLTPMSD